MTATATRTAARHATRPATLRGASVHPALATVSRQVGLAVIGGLLPVVATAFLTMPYTLGHHPGEAAAAAEAAVLASAANAPAISAPSTPSVAADARGAAHAAQDIAA